MKKIQVLLTTIVFLLIFVTTPSFVQAVTDTPTPVPSGSQVIDPCGGTNGILTTNLKGICNLNLGNVVGKFILYAFMFGAIIALLYLLWGGFKWITSGGDTKGVEGARSHIIAAIIGLIVIFLSYLILNFVIKILTGNDLNQLVFPSL